MGVVSTQIFGLGSNQGATHILIKLKI